MARKRRPRTVLQQVQKGVVDTGKTIQNFNTQTGEALNNGAKYMAKSLDGTIGSLNSFGKDMAKWRPPDVFGQYPSIGQGLQGMAQAAGQFGFQPFPKEWERAFTQAGSWENFGKNLNKFWRDLGWKGPIAGE